MRVVIAVPGRLHAFETAGQLHRRGHLHKVITPLPLFRIRRHTPLPSALFRSVLLHAGYRLSGRLPAPLRGLYSDARDCAVFDWCAYAALPRELDLCVAYAGSCLHTLQRAHRLGAKTVVERHSVHRTLHMQLLAEEHDRLGLPFQSDPELNQRELAEYDETDAIVIPSGFVERSFLERGYPAHKLIRVALGADLTLFRPVERHDPTFRVLFAGNFSVQKGVVYLLEAWRRLGLKDAELWFAGGVDEGLRALLRPDDVPGVRLLGHVDQRRLKETMGQCDVLCLPSVQDGFGVVMAQAMACGLPVIHSSNTGGRDLVRPGLDGFEFPIRDPEAIARLVERLYRDRELCRQLGQEALASVRALGGWNDYGDRITAAYTRLVGEHGTH